ncbi:MAG TPA: hypothetical protein DDW65_17580 [Firmicutes bacterium]|jgi:hypothetical protein|nr:hypothetical protein [Bacillota bacterium]
MIQIYQDDLLRALKRCKGIAKQDLLPNNFIPQSDFRRAHAEARRETYTKLIDLVESEGIQAACVFAFSTYQSLPVFSPGETVDSAVQGHAQALEMFFNVIGIAGEQVQALHNGNSDFSQLLAYTPEFTEEISSQSLVN